jgi:hypothetical protein
MYKDPRPVSFCRFRFTTVMFVQSSFEVFCHSNIKPSISFTSNHVDEHGRYCFIGRLLPACRQAGIQLSYGTIIILYILYLPHFSNTFLFSEQLSYLGVLQNVQGSTACILLSISFYHCYVRSIFFRGFLSFQHKTFHQLHF